MKRNSYIKCGLYSINDDFCIERGLSYKECILNSKKKYIDNIIVQSSSSGLREFLTGEVFDFSEVRVWEYYSKLLRRNVLKSKKRRSSEPIHISLYSEDLISVHTSRSNYEFVDDDDIHEYRETILIKYGSIQNYRRYLIHLKECANNIYEGAIIDFENQKTLKKIKR